MKLRPHLMLAPLVASAALVACSGSDDSEPAIVENRVALTVFDTCQALETYLEDTAIQEVNVALDNWKNFRGYGWGFGPPELLASDDSAQAGGANRTTSAPTDFTRTNTQVDGVDEADFVKTNGTHIFVLSGQKLYMTKSWHPTEMNIVASTEIEGYPREMFLDEDGNVIVFSYYYDNQTSDPRYLCLGCGANSMTKVTVLSTTGDQLTPTHQIFLHGTYANARRIDSSIRVVMRDHLNLPEGIQWYPENFEGDPMNRRSAWNAAIEALKASNATLIRNQTLDDWLPQDYYVTASDTRVDLPRACDQFFRSNAPVRLGIASIGTVNLSTNGGVTVSTASILGEVGEVYASREALYIASPHWWWWPQDGQENYTYLHKFDISNPSRSAYRASGVVSGYPLNQFAMDEHDGSFRIATTIDRTIHQGGVEEWNFRVETVNRVTVMQEQEGLLRVVGQTRDLAEGERIQSARFMGDKGYLVTFEQVDPLFTLELHDPTQPEIKGELKIPGFSSYLHPLGEDHLLAIGVDLPDPGPNGQVDWSRRSIKLSIFDVSDMTDPQEKFTQLVGTSNGWSEAAWNHKAFNYFASQKLLAIPFMDYVPDQTGADYWDGFTTDLRIFHVDSASGFDDRGRVSMGDLYITSEYPDWRWDWSPMVRRSVMASDDITTYAYAISDAGIRAVDISNLSAPLSTVLFDRAFER